MIAVSASALVLAGVPAAARDDTSGGNGATAVSRVMDCRAITDPPQRLACFDAATAALAVAAARKEIVITDRNTVRKTRRALFGFSLPKLKLFGNDDDNDDRDDVSSINATIAQVTTNASGRYVLGLDEGGRWAQDEAVYVNRPRIGQTVTITKGRIGGGYTAKVGTGRAFKVERLAE